MNDTNQVLILARQTHFGNQEEWKFGYSLRIKWERIFK